MKDLAGFYHVTGRMHLKYHLVTCKTCVWAFLHQEELSLVVIKEVAYKEFKKRTEQLTAHQSSCQYKHFRECAGVVPRNLAGSIPPVPSPSSIGPSESLSQQMTPTQQTSKKRKRKQTIFQPSFYKDSVVDKAKFEQNAVNVVASTGVPFSFFEDFYVVIL